MELSMEQLLKIENDRKILEFRFAYKDTPVWPFVRFCALQSLQMNTLQKPGKYRNSASAVRDSFLSKLGSGIVKNPFFSARKPIMFLYGCGGNVSDETGRIYNRIFDDFAGLYQHSTYVLDCTDRDIAKKSRLKKHYTYLMDSAVHSMVETGSTDPKDVAMAGRFLQYLNKRMLPFTLTHSQIENIRQLVLLYSKKIKYQDMFYRRLFQWVHPEIVFIEDGCYGERNAYLCKVLSELKIPSAEIQHGWIGAQHIAYNYGKTIRESREYRTYMPDYYCGMADYWLEQISAPVKKICFGNPAFWTKYNQFYKRSKEREEERKKKTILWLGFENDTRNMEVLREFLTLTQGEFQILLRNHPLLKEKSDPLYKNLLRNHPNLLMDKSQTVYEAFTESDYVVSEVSTAIYEALAFGKQVFVYQSALSRHFGMTEVAAGFKDAKQLSVILSDHKTCEKKKETVHKETFFAMQWKRNYSNFLKECTGINFK